MKNLGKIENKKDIAILENIEAPNFKVGDLIPYDMTQPLSDEWISLTNWRELKASEYPELAQLYPETVYTWERMNKLEDNFFPENNITIECVAYSNFYGQGGEAKTLTTMQMMLPDILAGGYNKATNVFPMPFARQNQPRDETDRDMNCFWIKLKSFSFETKNYVQHPYFVIGDIEYDCWLNSIDGNWKHPDFQIRTGEQTLGNRPPILATKVHMPVPHYEYTSSGKLFTSFAYYNKLQIQEQIDQTNEIDQYDNLSWNTLGFCFSIDSDVKMISLKRLEIWHRTMKNGVNIQILDIPPHMFVPNYEPTWDMTYNTYNEYTYGKMKQIGLKMYIGKKVSE